MSADFRFGLRVYWEDTDAGGVVFYANYLKFFERARTEWLRRAGYSQERLRVERGLMFIVGETSVRFLRPARLDDLLEVSVGGVIAGRASISVAQQAWRCGGTEATASACGAEPLLLAEGSIRIGCVDAGTFRPRRIPIDLLQALE